MRESVNYSMLHQSFILQTLSEISNCLHLWNGRFYHERRAGFLRVETSTSIHSTCTSFITQFSGYRSFNCRGGKKQTLYMNRVLIQVCAYSVLGLHYISLFRTIPFPITVDRYLMKTVQCEQRLLGYYSCYIMCANCLLPLDRQ